MNQEKIAFKDKNLQGKIGLSVVIPVFNEAENLTELYARLKKTVQEIELPYELIFVDDGSEDKSFEILGTLHREDNNVKVIKLCRNFGHHIALSAGLDYCTGEAVVLMDADLQDKPEDIPELLLRLKQGFDVAYAVRKIQKGPLIDRLTSRIFYIMMKRLTKIGLPQNAGIFRAMRKNVADVIKGLKEKSRFLPILIDWTGFHSAGVPVEREDRVMGKRKYNHWKRIKLAVTAVISFSRFPLQVAGYLGLVVSILSFVWAIYLIIKKIFFGSPIMGYTSLMASVFFLAGVQLIILGFLGEYIGKIFEEVQNRPLYIIEKVIE
jgi:glycosyltransferase involved in cell wall biosynthesis